LWYLSLFLCHWFGIVFPYLLSSPRNIQHTISDDDDTHGHNEPLLSDAGEHGIQLPARTGEEPITFPVHMLLLPYIPLGLAIFIAGTRYFDFRNHGFDVLAGAFIGLTTASFGFRIYHPSLWG
jgi:hypothetical protein